MDGNDVGKLIDLGMAPPPYARETPPAPLPGVDLSPPWASENNNPFDLVSLQSECRDNDPFERALVDALTFRARDGVEEAHTFRAREGAEEAGNASLLDVSNLSLFPDDPELGKPVAATSKKRIERDAIVALSPAKQRGVPFDDSKRSDLPALESKAQPTDLEVIANVKSRVERCIRDALVRSKMAAASRDDAENLSPNVPARSQTPTKSPIGRLASARKGSNADSSIVDIGESLRRIRTSSVTLTGEASPAGVLRRSSSLREPPPSRRVGSEESIFEEAKALASVFREKADSFVADPDASSDEASFCDLRTSRRQWETSALRLPQLEMEMVGTATRPPPLPQLEMEGTATRPPPKTVATEEGGGERSQLRAMFDDIMSMKPGEPGNRSLRRSLSSGFIQPESTSPVAPSTPAPLSRDKVRDLALQPRPTPSSSFATPAPPAPPPPLREAEFAAMRPRRNVVQSGSAKRGPMKAVIPLGSMVRRQGSPPKAVRKSPDKPPRKSRSPSRPMSTPVAPRRSSAQHAEMVPRCTSTPHARSSSARRSEVSPAVSPVQRAPARSQSLNASGSGRGRNESPPPTSHRRRSFHSTPAGGRSPAAGHLKSLPSPILNPNPSNVVVNYAQTPKDLSVQTWNRGPVVTVSTVPLKLASLKGTIYDVPKGGRRTPPPTPPPRQRNPPPLGTSRSANVSASSRSLERNDRSRRSKPSTPNVLKDANEKVSRLPVSKLPVSASPRQIPRLQSMVARKFQRNTSLPCEKENIRPVY